MSESAPIARKKLVFLHIPKTAGQTVRQALRRAFGKERESPVKTRAQAKPYGTCFPDPDRYDLFSGHIDWHDLDQRIPQPRRVFTILREPRERLASFYFYQHANAESEQADDARRVSLRLIRSLSADDFLANPDIEHRVRIDAMYDNFQTLFLATRRIQHQVRQPRPSPETLVATALANARSLDLVCRIDQLDRVESLVRTEFGMELELTGSFVNRGRIDPARSRFAELMSRVRSQRTRDRIEEMCALDDELMRELGL